MTQELYPNNNCGECPGWLAFGEDGGPQSKEELINVMCKDCYIYNQQRYGDHTCVSCGHYASEGHLCKACLSSIPNDFKVWGGGK
jgi:hypothetical protein